MSHVVKMAGYALVLLTWVPFTSSSAAMAVTFHAIMQILPSTQYLNHPIRTCLTHGFIIFNPQPHRLALIPISTSYYLSQACPP